MKSWIKYCLIIMLLILAGTAGLLTSFHFFHRDETEITAVQPPDIGSQDVQLIQTVHYPAAFSAALKGDPKAGEKVFKAYCQSCHANPPEIPVNAPLIGIQKDWALRRKIPMPTLLQICLMGVGAMPARGGCFECTDEQIQKAIEYILDKSQ